MNQRQKNKFHKAIKSLSDLMLELNSGCESWELRYNNCDNKFHLSKMSLNTLSYINEEQDETYFPCFDMEE